ncbi:MAG TPA: sigma-54-dependent Fis family transcriptional regulator [Gammaproteobacteria bacterium]|nr:sigma-54-dependent Fis family transcriptional regulator [Gammaproteobacteria bacterium]
MSTILIVDDDTASCRTLQLHFRSQGHETVIGHSVDEGLRRCERAAPDLIVLDIRMPGRSGLDGLPDFKKCCPRSGIIMITAFHDMESTIQAMQRGADDYIHKPIDIDELDSTVARILATSGASSGEVQRVGERDGTPPSMVGRSRRMKEVFKTIGMVADSPVTVLITGESGTGKELVARAIHRSGSRAAGPFVAVNCAALVETLLESELFGHEKGAFTGAVSSQPGKFALARGGTIFLDEIGETSPAIQAKLLRVLQEKEFTPLGAKRAEHTDARIIAATNLNIEESVRQGSFREDLYYRLQVVNIHLPPLRERKEDLLDLVQTLLARINREIQCNISGLTMEVMECFQRYDWPGNVRELENVLMKSAALCAGSTITMDLLPPALRRLDRAPGQASDRPDWQLSLEEVEAMHVLRVLNACSWHKGRACEILGVSRPRLRRMIQHYALEPPSGSGF